MPFPLGGDFSRSIERALKVVKTDSRVCAHDNGTAICDLGHKLHFAGQCFNQAMGTWNSTDASFQPDFPICTADFESRGQHPAVLFAIEAGAAGDTKIGVREDFAVESELILADLLLAVSSFAKIRQTDGTLEGATFLAQLLLEVESAYSIVQRFIGPSSSWKFAQFNPGDVEHLPGTHSDTLFPYDIIGLYKPISYLDFRTGLISINQPNREKDSSLTLVTTDFYTTLSGSADMCQGDRFPPYITPFNPAASGTVFSPRDQIVDFSISDATMGVDITKVFVVLYSSDRSNINLVTAGSPGADVSITGNTSSYRITYDPPFLWNFNEDIRVTISGADLPQSVVCSGITVNHVYGELTFRMLDQTDLTATISGVEDTIAPYLVDILPASGTVGNNVFLPISFSVADDLSGVNLSKLAVTFNGVNIVASGVAFASTFITGGPWRYNVTYSGVPFTYGTSPTICVYAEDRYANVLNTCYSFSYISDSTLLVENFIPPVGITHIV